MSNFNTTIIKNEDDTIIVTKRALLITGSVRVILLGGGFGESSRYAITSLFSDKSRWWGNNDAVWPSGPIPVQNKTGKKELRK